MNLEAKIDLAERVGRELRRRDMRGHRPPIVAYWHSLRTCGKPPAEGWDDELVQAWAKAFQLPPFHTVEVRPPSSSCTCGDMWQGKERPMVFEGGALVKCLACGAEWLELRASSRR